MLRGSHGLGQPCPNYPEGARLRTARSTGTSTKRYETFVVRLWVEDEGKVEHGEIRHVGSSASAHFRETARVLAFIRMVIGPNDDDAVNPGLTVR
jgi:hypothetical protein